MVKRSKLTRIIGIILILVLMITLVACAAEPAAPVTPDTGADPGTATPADPPPADDPAEPDDADTDEFVTLSWYVNVWSEARTFGSEIGRIVEHINEFLVPEINAELDLNLLDVTTYDATMPAMIAAGEVFDIIGISGGLNYQTFVRANAFVALDDLLPVYAPVTYNEVIAPLGWDAARVNGVIYAFVPFKDWAERGGWLYNKTMAEDLGIDMSNVSFPRESAMSDLQYRARDLRDEKYPELAHIPIGGDAAHVLHYNFLYERLIGHGNLAAINVSSNFGLGFAGFDKYEVFSPFETPEFREAMHRRRQHVVDGIAPAEPNFDPDRVLQEFQFHLGIPTGYVEFDEDINIDKGFKTGIIFSDISLVTGASVRNGLQSISTSSRNPERAVQFLEIVFSRPEIITTMAFGIEGVDWKNDNGVVVWDEPGYLPRGTWGPFWYPWMFGTITRTAALPRGFSADFPRLIEELNRDAYFSDAMGFTMNLEPIANQISACDAVIPEFMGANGVLELGQSDNVDALVDDFIAKLRANGLQEILDETQRQLNAWIAEN